MTHLEFSLEDYFEIEQQGKKSGEEKWGGGGEEQNEVRLTPQKEFYLTDQGTLFVNLDKSVEIKNFIANFNGLKKLL